MSASRKLLDDLRAAFDVDVFVETGTYLGATAAWAAQRFDQVYTVEVSPKLFETAAARLASRPNVTRRLADTRTFLRDVVPYLSSRTMFWLDAHWSQGRTAGAEEECPVMQELVIIEELGHGDDIIIIDDARLFLAPPPEPHDANQWPSITAITSELTSRHARYVSVVDDQIIAVPAEERGTLVAVLRKHEKRNRFLKTMTLENALATARRVGDRLSSGRG